MSDDNIVVWIIKNFRHDKELRRAIWNLVYAVFLVVLLFWTMFADEWDKATFVLVLLVAADLKQRGE